MLSNNKQAEAQLNKIVERYSDPVYGQAINAGVKLIAAKFKVIQQFTDSLYRLDPNTHEQIKISSGIIKSLQRQYKETLQAMHLIAPEVYGTDFTKLYNQIALESNFVENFSLNDPVTGQPKSPMGITDMMGEFRDTVSKFNAFNRAEQEKRQAEKQQVDDASIKYMRQQGQLGKHDDMRYMNKAMLITRCEENEKILQQLKVSENNPELLADIDEILDVMESIKEYGKIDVRAVDIYNASLNTGDKPLPDEAALYDRIQKKLSELNEKIQGQAKELAGENANYDNISLMVAGFGTYFDGQIDGNLMSVADKDIAVDATGQKFIRKNEADDYDVNYKDVPLFPHDPSYSDIKQGALGDCYLVSSLSSIAIDNADKIKEAMVDNGDGTVTVRFWQKNLGGGNGRGEGETYTPLYVKVDKIAPKAGGAQASAWVQTLERAYAASGLSSGGTLEYESDQYTKALPKMEELDAMYEKYSKLPKHELPSHTECPWLIDERGNLHKYQPTYKNIDGGSTGVFIEHLLGEAYKANVLSMQEINKVGKATEPIDVMAQAILDAGIEEGIFENQTQINSYNHILIGKKDSLEVTNAFYKMITGSTQDMPKDEKGQYLINSSNSSKIAHIFENDLFLFEQKVRSDVEAGIRKPSDWTGLRQFFDGLKNGSSIPVDKDQGKELRDAVLGDPYFKAEYDKLLDTMEKAFDKTYQKNMPHQKYDGKYNQTELDLYNQIKKAIDNKNPVTLSTNKAPDNSGDTRTKNGMHYGHAFTVLGVEEKTTPSGEVVKFLKVRNPHAGKLARDYKMKDGKLTPKEITNAENGEGLIELSDVLEDCKTLTINEPPAYEKISKTVTDGISAKDISKYTRCLEAVSDQLNTKSGAFSKDSDAYRELVDAVNDVQKRLPDMLGRDSSEMGLLFDRITPKIEAYEQHCKKKVVNNGPRKARVEACGALKDLIKLGRSNVKDPNQAIKENTARSIAGKLAESKKIVLSDAQKDALAKNVLESKEFKKSFGQGNFMQVARINSMPADKPLKAFVDYSKQMNAPVAAQPGEPAPQKVDAQVKGI